MRWLSEEIILGSFMRGTFQERIRHYCVHSKRCLFLSEFLFSSARVRHSPLESINSERRASQPLGCDVYDVVHIVPEIPIVDTGANPAADSRITRLVATSAKFFSLKASLAAAPINPPNTVPIA
jgi:hypothetical protein